MFSMTEPVCPTLDLKRHHSNEDRLPRSIRKWSEAEFKLGFMGLLLFSSFSSFCFSLPSAQEPFFFLCQFCSRVTETHFKICSAAPVCVSCTCWKNRPDGCCLSCLILQESFSSSFYHTVSACSCSRGGLGTRRCTCGASYPPTHPLHTSAGNRGCRLAVKY